MEHPVPPADTPKRALIAMSGGVDSSVAAWLTMRAGFDCVGVTMRLFDNPDAGVPKGHPCCSLRDIQDAYAAAARLGIPFHAADFSREFRDKVIRPFAESYLRGETPNPCIACNRHMKFDLLHERASLLDCDMVVTGHYARIEHSGGRWRLLKGVDPGKDQSYVLYDMTQDTLAHTLFPLGGMRKEETRRLAEELGLANAKKHDSQDICFAPDGNYARVVERYAEAPCPEGDFLDTEGRVLGRHRGILHYTIGQRRGLGVSGGERLYVLEIRPRDNTVVLGPNALLYSREVYARNFNWISGVPPASDLRVDAKIRYRHAEQPAWARCLPDGTVRVEFDEPQRAVTAGQSVVLYDGEEVLGGGEIFHPALVVQDYLLQNRPSCDKMSAKLRIRKQEEYEMAAKESKGRKRGARKAQDPVSAAPEVTEAPVTLAAAEDAAAVETAETAVETAAAEAAEAPKAAREAPVEAAPEAAEALKAAEETPVEAAPEAAEAPAEPALPQPRRSVVFIGSECYPFVKTGGLGDVMYALPRALTKQNCDVKVILPRYKCIPWEQQVKMVYRGAFQMDLCSDGRSYYVGIMEYVHDGVVYDFIDNEEFFSDGNPYTNLIDDIPKFCFFSKAALAALNYMDWVPDVIHCHDWQAALVPLYLRTLFADTALRDSKCMITIHNLRFQGIYDIPTIHYWSGLPEVLFKDVAVLKQGYNDANMMKGGLDYADMITTVSNTYAEEIKTPFFGENLDAHLRHHAGKLRGIVNGIDCDIWDSRTDSLLAANYGRDDAVEQKKANKMALQEKLGLEQDAGKFVIGLISRLTNQKGLDLVNTILPALMDGNTQVVVLGTGDKQYEEAFRQYENAFKGSVCSNIMYDEGRAHQIYAGSDALLVPSLFEPCGLTQLIAMRYGTVPIVRETGGLKDTVQPYNQFTNEGNGFTFDRYESGLLLDAINRAKTLYFTERDRWDEMVLRDMDKDVSWDNSAKQYRSLYLELRP